MSNQTLTEIGYLYNTDKATEHNYTAIYDAYLQSLRFNKLNFLEIGVYLGGSIKMWKEYFQESEIYSFDICDKTQYTESRIHIEIGDQSNINFLENVFRDITFDIILDDGSHMMHHQQISFANLFKRLHSGGVYILEDLHTSLNAPNDHASNPYNTTLNLLKYIKGDLQLNFDYYISKEEIQYLKDNIELIDIIDPKTKWGSLTSVIVKK